MAPVSEVCVMGLGISYGNARDKLIADRRFGLKAKSLGRL